MKWRLRRLWSVAVGFVRLGFLQSIAYPLGYISDQVGSVVPAITFLFVGRLVERSTPDVGGDFYSFVIVGLLVMQVMNAGVVGFPREIDHAVMRGHFEMLLVEPVPWRLLPFWIVLWPAVTAVLSVGLIVVVAILLGADFRLAGLPIAVVTAFLAIVAGLTLGILSSSLKVLAKRGDPVLFFVTLGAQVLSGVFFPVGILPLPLRVASFLLPHTHAIVAARRALLPAGAALPGLGLGQSLLALLAFDIIGICLAVWLFGRSMETGRRYGLLAGY
jgi:ABC-2 type transport system permease protein